MDKKVIYLDDVLETIEKCEHYPLFDTKKIKEGIVDFLGLGIGYWDIKEAIEQLPSAQPSYTDEQIQKMQELEQAEIEKAFQLGKEDAQPERKKGKWIDVDPYGDSGLAFKCSECGKINLRESNYCPNCGSEQLPSAQPEIIRCKDCKYGEDCGAYESYSCLYYGEEFRLGYLADDFCSRAERKTNGREDQD